MWYLSKRECKCWVFSLTQAKGLSGDSKRSLRNAWSFSLCPEVGVGQENSISVFSLMLQPGTSPGHSLKKRCVPNRPVLRLPRAGLLWPQRSLGEAEGKRRDPQGTSSLAPHHPPSLVAPPSGAPGASSSPGGPCPAAAMEKLQPWTRATLRNSSTGGGGGWTYRTLNSLPCLTCSF